jgi:hypothetical protein
LTPPPAPVVNKVELDKQIILDWGEDPNPAAATENYSSNGYTFQGYNVYQLPSATATVDQGVRIAVFDKVDGVLKILDWVYDPNVGAVEKLVRQFGNDSGIKRYIEISSDRISGSPLVNGNKYYFAVTAYSYNPDPNIIPNNFENPIQIISVTPNAVPGSIPSGYVGNISHTGTSDDSITVKVVNPFKILNHSYQVFFTTRAEIRNENGDWVASTPADTAVGRIYRIAKYWNLKDSTNNQIKLENQSVVNGIDLYPKRDDIPTNVGIDAAPIVDGFQIYVSGTYTSPINFANTKLTKGPGSNTQLTQSSNYTTLDIQNYSIYSGTISSKAIDNYGIGTNDINELQKDYIFKFTGVWGSIQTGAGQTLNYIKSGGQWATIFAATSLAAHPLNSSPGTNAPFLIKIPFEVWSKDENRQINLMFRDRNQSETDSPFWAWNPINRMYAITVDTPYDSVNVIPVVSDPLNSKATWVLVFYGTNYSTGDQVEVDYSNPIQAGVDQYTFTPTNVTGINENNTIPLKFMLSQNYPNPFNPSTTIKYSIPNANVISLKIYDVLGREVRTLLNEYKTQGTYYVNFNASGLSSGVYFYRLTAGNYSDVKKLMLIK